ncbi:MAG TPA: hypothetical protein VJ909_00215 [Prolixibacteraceae bacterium]|nr:hypothetical protein [Prolixibacteraceae bacterium]
MKLKQIIVALFTFLIGFVIVNDVSNMHVHQLDNDKMVIHAHPFNKSQDNAPVKQHHHSTFDFLQIQHAQILLWATFVTFSFHKILLKEYKVDAYKAYKNLCLVNQQRDRAPPVFA